jgi:hypothetical protein
LSEALWGAVDGYLSRARDARRAAKEAERAQAKLDQVERARAETVDAREELLESAVKPGEDGSREYDEWDDAAGIYRFAAVKVIEVEAPTGALGGYERVVQANQITPQLRVQRNAIVALTLRSGGLEIQTEGRALAEGGVGDVIDIMNLSSRTRISGRINSDGSVLVTAATSSE